MSVSCRTRREGPGLPQDRSEIRIHEDERELATRLFLAERSRLLRVARRVVKDHAAAEDVVQDVWIRWQRVELATVHNPVALLTTTTTHAAINAIQTARHRHEQPTDAFGGSAFRADAGAAGDGGRVVDVERMLGLLMAKLSPAELAAYVLRKTFDYPYRDVGELLDATPDNARQLVRRAQLALGGSRCRRVDRVDHRRLVAAFRAAASGELAGLERVLVGRIRPCPTAAGSPVVGRRRPAAVAAPVGEAMAS
jgi:RNA polymerase sigma-70 factor (ECF subfamily)